MIPIRVNILYKIADILLKYKTRVTVCDIQETGSTPHSTIEVIRLCQTGITIVPKFID